MTKNRFILFLFNSSALMLASCTTYYLPVESFQRQFFLSDSSGLREVTTQGPMGEKKTYRTYAMDSVHVQDKNGHPVSLPYGPAIEMRITDEAHKKTIFYLDLIRFDGENITGSPSRILPSIKKQIPISRVRKIEVQDGKKKFRYVD